MLDLEKLLFDEEVEEKRRCERCGNELPTDRYHLKICRSCRKESLSEFKGKNAKFKLVFFDGGGVLFDVLEYEENDQRIALSSWNVVFHEFGIYQEHERLKRAFLRGEFQSYMEWTDAAMKVLKKAGLSWYKFHKIIQSRPLMPGSRETFAELRQRNVKTAIITGSFDMLAYRAKRTFELDYAVGHCRLLFDNNKRLKSWVLTPCDFDGKVTYFKKIADGLGINYSECAYVGGNVNDIPIFRKVGLAIAFNAAKPGVRKSADVVIEKKDLREVLPYVL